MLITISLETSMKKLVRLAAHTLRGNVRQPDLGEVAAPVSDILSSSILSSAQPGGWYLLRQSDQPCADHLQRFTACWGMM
jgi:hypothetical protein